MLKICLVFMLRNLSITKHINVMIIYEKNMYVISRFNKYLESQTHEKNKIQVQEGMNVTD